MTVNERRMIVEPWARGLVEEELQLVVELNDDQSRPSMYDLRVGPAEAPVMAIECVGAVDPVRVETWNIGPAKGPLTLELDGDWIVCLLLGKARIKSLDKRLEPILSQCEERGLVSNLRVDWTLKRNQPELFAELTTLGVEWASCYRSPGHGKVYLTVQGIGGCVDTNGSTIAAWIGKFLLAPERADVLSKLARSGAAERHVFVVVDFGGATFPVESYLAGPIDALPAVAPILPSTITGVWLTSTSSGIGVRWTGTTWKRFRAVWREGTA